MSKKGIGTFTKIVIALAAAAALSVLWVVIAFALFYDLENGDYFGYILFGLTVLAELAIVAKLWGALKKKSVYISLIIAALVLISLFFII